MDEESNKEDLNILLPKLFQDTTKFSTNLSNRMKVHLMFSEFEDKAHHKLNSFIKDSSQRYKNIKFGKRLDNVLDNSQKTYKSLAKKIFEDTFFTSLNLDKDKEKFKKKTDKDLYKDLLFEMNRIKECTNTLPKADMSEAVERLRKQNSCDRYQINHLKTQRKKTYVSTNSLSPYHSNEERRELSKKNEQIYLNFLDNELNGINKKINSYNDYINQLKNCKDTKEIKELKKNTNLDSFDFNFQKNLPSINYQNLPPPVAEKIKEDNSPDMTKLLRFSRMGKNIIRISTNPEENKYEQQKQKITDLHNRLNDRNIRYDDTISLVTKEANRRVLSNQYFLEKMKNFDKKINKDRQLPKLEDYDNIIKAKFNYINNRREEYKKRNMISLSDLFTNEEERLTEFIKEKKKKYNFTDINVDTNDNDDELRNNNINKNYEEISNRDGNFNSDEISNTNNNNTEFNYTKSQDTKNSFFVTSNFMNTLK